MKQNTEKQLALHLLAHKRRGYSILHILNASKYRYIFHLLLIAALICCYFWIKDKILNLFFLFTIGMLVGAVVRDIGWIRRMKMIWPFNERVIDWKKVEEIAEKKE